eukprot:s1205_g25.t1
MSHIPADSECARQVGLSGAAARCFSSHPGVRLSEEGCYVNRRGDVPSAEAVAAWCLHCEEVCGGTAQSGVPLGGGVAAADPRVCCACGVWPGGCCGPELLVGVGSESGGSGENCGWLRGGLSAGVM